MPYGVHTWMQPMQQARSHPPVDRVFPQAQIAELPPGDYSVLSSRQLGYLAVKAAKLL